MVALPLISYGQLSGLSDQYLNNTLTFNPAFAGSEDALSISLVYRNQWVGFDGAPRNYSLLLHAPVRNDRIGIGLLLESSRFSIYREKSIKGDYAFRMEVLNGTLALGLGAGITVKNVAWDDLIATDANDILLTNYPESAVLPDISLGTYYYNKKFFLGISIPGLLIDELNPNTRKYSMNTSLTEYNYYFEGGYNLNLNRHVRFLPSFLLKYHPGHVPQLDVTTHLFLMERFGLGLGYRNKKSLLGIVQVQLNRQIMIAYSYGFDTGRVGRYNNGSHEVVLNYLFNYSYGVAGPRQF